MPFFYVLLVCTCFKKVGLNDYPGFQMLQAYCTIDGVPVDVLIDGVAAQNRAVSDFFRSSELPYAPLTFVYMLILVFRK